MWSLPDIGALNARAEEEHRKRKGRAPGLRGKTCEFCDEKAVVREPYYDIFGKKDVPKGYVFMCREHADAGTLGENYFWCEGCNRYHVTNYTWELYTSSDPETGESLCLRCAFERYIEDPEHWITEVPEEIGLEELRGIPHLIGVETSYWEDHLAFIGNAEFDSMTGSQISGKPILEIVRKALAKHRRCIIILDAGWQFAVSFGVYVDRN